MKFILSFFFVCCLFFAGCSVSKEAPENTLCLQVELNDRGEVSQTIEIPTFLEEDNDKYLKELVSTIEKKIYNNYYITYYIACLKVGEDVKNIMFTKPYYDTNSQKVKFSFQFSNQSFLSSINATSGELCLSFLEKSKVEKAFPFFEKNKDGVMVCNYYLDVVDEVYSKYFGSGVDRESVLLEYRYITPYKNLHSNADVKAGCSHSWLAKMGGLDDDKKIEIWVNSPNRGAWYLVVIILMAGAYLLIWLHFNKKSRFAHKYGLKKKNLDRKH